MTGTEASYMWTASCMPSSSVAGRKIFFFLSGLIHYDRKRGRKKVYVVPKKIKGLAYTGACGIYAVFIGNRNQNSLFCVNGPFYSFSYGLRSEQHRWQPSITCTFMYRCSRAWVLSPLTRKSYRDFDEIAFSGSTKSSSTLKVSNLGLAVSNYPNLAFS